MVSTGGRIFLIFCFYVLMIVDAAEIITKLEEEDAVIPADDSFPADFSFGVATAAYQIEGGWDADGKGPSIWDKFTHEHPEMIADRSNGDVGPNSYNLFDEDLKALKELGVDHYRFSISWSRVLPKADKSEINKQGINYYNEVINKLLENNIVPMVTMYHYDLPQELQKIGGLANPLFINYFKDYADLLFSAFGDRVKTWITFNEPYDFCVPGYGKAVSPPLANSSGVGEYLCMHHVIQGHALAYRHYKEKYSKDQKGKVGITLSSRFFYSRKNNNDVVDRAMQFALGWTTNPLFSKNGGYPAVMVEDILSNSIQEGRTWSRLPNLDAYWTKLIHGACDFLGINYYTARFVDWADPPEGVRPSIDYDSKLKYETDPKWKRAKSAWLYSVPQGLGDLLRWINENYDNIEVIITENGWSDDGQLNDDDRIRYLKEHLNQVLKAINDGCNVTGYTHWSLIDNFEWLLGYTEKFGLYNINLTSPNKERTAKKSAAAYKSIIKQRKISV